MSALRLSKGARPVSRALLQENRFAARSSASARRGAVLDSKRTFLTVIEQGKEAWRLSRYPRMLVGDPGLAWVHLRQYSYKACFAISDVERNISNTGTSVMRSVLGAFSYDEVIANRNSLNERLNVVIGDSIANWGVECTRFEIQTFKPANREVERQLELQMEAERNRRKQLLDTQAQVNVAEGNKQRVILESEGHLVAKSNEADASYKTVFREAEASYKTVFREAEARKQQSLMEISALAQQVEELAKALSPNPDHIAPEARMSALEKLVELRRLEQLRAIASSQNNSTYFFGDRSALGQDGYNVDYAEQIKGGMHKKTPATVTASAVQGA
ncbi:hypothetical protein HWV62_36789 [Athelia sp. TMB]|nr:hypothetical protein HWV62_36789 [Athelia sp. TMB]